jgi:outer membrane protein assembly factor BamB
LWNEKIESFRGMNILTPVVTADGKVFSSAHSGKSRMLSVASENGSVATVKQLWDNKAQGYMSSPVVIGDYIYLHMKNQRFVCLDMRDGTEKWTTQPFGKYWSMVGNPKTAQILALDEAGQLRLIAADPSGYRLISEEKVADDSWAHLAVQPIVGGAGDKDQGLAIIVRALDRIRVYRWQ